MRRWLISKFAGFICGFLSITAMAPCTAQTGEVAQLQALLKYAGYDVGAVDGISGRRTTQALGNYANENELSEINVEQIISHLIASLGLGHLYQEAITHVDDHVASSALLRAALPSERSIIRDYERFRQYRNHYSQNYSWTGWLWNEASLETGEPLDQTRCHQKLLNFEAPTRPGPREPDLVTCQLSYATQAVLDLDYGVELYGSLFLDMATAEPDRWVYRRDPAHGRNNNPSFYHLGGILSTFMVFYAANAAEFDYTEAEHEKVYSFFREKALQERFDLDGDGRTLPCPINAPMDLTEEYHQVNNCGTVRLRFAAAELALAIMGQDELLWRKGLWDLDYTLSMINDEGFFVPTSAKGCMALGYLHDTSRLFSLNAEILMVAGFDLLRYITRHGVQMSDAYAMLYKQYDDVTISNHIARKGIGSTSCGRIPYNTHEEFIIEAFGSIDNEWVPSFERSLNWGIRYVTAFRPEWLSADSLTDIPTEPFVGAYFTVQPFEIFFANITSETDGIWSGSPSVSNNVSSIISQQTLDTQSPASSVGEWLRGHLEEGIAYGLQQTSFTFRDAQQRDNGRTRLRFLVAVSDRSGTPVFDGRVSYSLGDDGGALGIDLEPIIASSEGFAEDWQQVLAACGDSHEVYPDWIDIPVTRNDEIWMDSWDCISQTNVSDQSKILFASWMVVASNIDEEAMKFR
jgi:hypothetical protein